MTCVRLVGAIASGAPFMSMALGPVVRLARGNGNRRGEEAISGAMTTTRLVGATDSTARRDIEAALGPQLRLVGATADEGNVQQRTAFAVEGNGSRPALLISYAYWKSFVQARDKYSFRDYALDSGAYTVEHSGGTVDLTEYTEFAAERLATDPQCVEVFALDVISDWRASVKNVEAMWKAGVPAIPVYHRGEPEDVLLSYARDYPKIALGGFSRLRGDKKLLWAKACFARVWPARIHGLAVMGEEMLTALPFHSVDASNWEMGPACFGSYRSMGKPHRAPRGGNISLRAEVEWYLKLERRLQQQWAREMAMLGRECKPWPLRVVDA